MRTFWKRAASLKNVKTPAKDILYGHILQASCFVIVLAIATRNVIRFAEGQHVSLAALVAVIVLVV